MTKIYRKTCRTPESIQRKPWIAEVVSRFVHKSLKIAQSSAGILSKPPSVFKRSTN